MHGWHFCSACLATMWRCDKRAFELITVDIHNSHHFFYRGNFIHTSFVRLTCIIFKWTWSMRQGSAKIRGFWCDHYNHRRQQVWSNVTAMASTFTLYTHKYCTRQTSPAWNWGNLWNVYFLSSSFFYWFYFVYFSALFWTSYAKRSHISDYLVFDVFSIVFLFCWISNKVYVHTNK